MKRYTDTVCDECGVEFDNFFQWEMHVLSGCDGSNEPGTDQ